MRPFRSLLAFVPLALAGACVTSAPPRVAEHSQATAGEAAPPGVSAYGLFLAGQAAIDSGQSAEASSLFSQAAAAEGDNGLLASEAFTAALLAGEVEKASSLAPDGPGAETPVRRLGVLTRGVEAMAEGRGKAAHAILSGPDAGPAHNAAAALMAPFAAALAGDKQGAITRPLMPGDPVDQFQANIDQGELYERQGRFDEAETAFRSLIASGDPGGVASLDLGEFLERRGRAADAVGIYDAGLRRNPENGFLREARARAAAHRKAPPLRSIRQLAAQALLAPSASLLIQRNEEGALACLRLALRLDPKLDEGWIMVGDIMADVGDKAGARAAYEEPKPGSPQYVEARGKLAWTYQNDGDKQEALKIARNTLAGQPASDEAAVTLADIERVDERYDESAEILDRLIRKAGDHPDWRLLYMRAAAYQQTGRWPDAERDLETALKLKPDEPELLNFLGYSWIDRGENLKQAILMIQKAVDQNPQSGAMLDSLGWGYYRLGDYTTAVEKLEAAVALDAADPDVNNHLGDAYWRVGRKTEAQYQWKRVLTLDPNAKLRAEIEVKLKSGPDDHVIPSDLTGS
ncbi:MAG: tetratricopeptide repeat protein [Caulobacteraceae bacterium]